MQNNLHSKYKSSPAISPKQRSPSHRGIQPFDKYFEDVMARKNNQYTIMESPHLKQRLKDIHSNINDRYLSAISTPTTKVLKRIERKKYIDLKQKIIHSVSAFSKSDLTSLKDLFQCKQVLLNEFLNDFTAEIERECREKGEILKYIWNSMFGMIEHISEELSRNLKEKEKLQLEKGINQHLTYQSMIQSYKEKQQILTEKAQAYKVTLSKLVYELRFKRKEINKLYKNQKLLVNRLNQYKDQNLSIQSNYIDLVSSFRDTPPEKVEQMIKAREELNRSRQTKFKVKDNKKANRVLIAQQLSHDRTSQLNELFQELKEIANHQLNSPHVVSTLIEAAIENFAILNDDAKGQDQKLVSVADKYPTMETQTQVDEYYFKKQSKVDQITQFSFFDRITSNMINNKVTQTFCDYGKKKILIDKGVGTDSEKMRKKYVDWNFRICRVIQQHFWTQKEEPPTIVMSPIKFERNHKKHYSEVNVLRGKLGPQKISKIEGEPLEMQEFPNQLEEGPNRDSEPISQLDQLIDLETEPVVKGPLKVKIPRKTPKIKMLNSTVGSVKRNTNKMMTRKASKQNVEYQKTKQSQHTAPISRFKERQTHKEHISIISALGTPNEEKRLGSQAKNQYSKLRSDFIRSNFLSTNNIFNIHIDEKKEHEILSFFAKKDHKQTKKALEKDMDQEEEKEGEENELRNSLSPDNLDNQVIAMTLNHIDHLPLGSRNRLDTLSPQGKRREARVSMQVWYEDENDLLMNVCRSNYFRKSKKKSRERVGRESKVEVKDEFTCVLDNIEMIARDVRELIVHKQEILKRSFSNKNIKNMYKILMMTFAKAYDCYNKGVPITNLVYPLFESFSLIYGAINTAEVYKKMINFIACISVKPDNTILHFFLFFLGLDTQSSYSAQVTISEVYLCLALLEKISVEGKVTLNIDSIYTDTVRIKQQLTAVLIEQNVPNHLCQNIKNRVDVELQNSATLRNSGDSETHFKINIYNIILLIVQQVIKSKSKLMDSMIPIFSHCPDFKTSKIVPTQLLSTLLLLSPSNPTQRAANLHLIAGLKKGNIQLSPQQFCSILFEHDISSVEQILMQNTFLKCRWRVPEEFITSVRYQVLQDKFQTPQVQFDLTLLLRLVDTEVERDSQVFQSIEVMKRLIFIKYYFLKVEEVQRSIVNEDLLALVQSLLQ